MVDEVIGEKKNEVAWIYSPSYVGDWGRRIIWAYEVLDLPGNQSKIQSWEEEGKEARRRERRAQEKVGEKDCFPFPSNLLIGKMSSPIPLHLTLPILFALQNMT